MWMRRGESGGRKWEGGKEVVGTTGGEVGNLRGWEDGGGGGGRAGCSRGKKKGKRDCREQTRLIQIDIE